MLQNASVCDEVTPANVEDDADTALMKALEETYVTVVGDPSLCAMEESGKFHSSVDLNICLVIQAYVAPNTFVQFAK